MLNFLPPFILGPLIFLVLLANTIFWVLLILLISLLRLPVPSKAWNLWCARASRAMGRGWIRVTNGVVRFAYRIEWEVEDPGELDRQGWHLLISNHQSWVDIPVLVQVFGERLPFPVFFAKKQLLWVPFLGAGLWILGFPLLERHSREYLEKHPEQRGKDLEKTRLACRRLREVPTTVVIFPEGTRFTPEKHALQKSPFPHLLRPKAGGIASVLASLGDRIPFLVDVTIRYPEGRPTFWGFLSGRVRRVLLRIRRVSLTPELREGDYFHDPEFRRRFQEWLVEGWQEKEELVQKLASSPPSP